MHDLDDDLRAKLIDCRIKRAQAIQEKVALRTLPKASAMR
jgi:hypothetical protein